MTFIALERSSCMPSLVTSLGRCVCMFVLGVTKKTHLLFCARFLFWTLHLDIWAPFLKTVSDNTIKVFHMQVFCPSILLSSSLSPGNRITCWLGSVSVVCNVLCSSEKERSKSISWSWNRKWWSLWEFLGVLWVFRPAPGLLACWVLLFWWTVAFFWYVEFLILILS